MGLKLSKYNRYIEIKSGYYFVHNILSSSQAILDFDEYKELVECKNQNKKEQYKQMGFWVDENTDEEAYLELERKLAMYNSLRDDFGLVIAPTMDCNARCFYCYEHDTRNEHYMDSKTEEQLLKFIVDSLFGKKKLWISWFGGEPLLCTSMINRISKQLISYCSENNIIFDSEMTTNGYYCGEYKEIIKQSNISEIQITIDGFKKDYETRKNYYNNIVDPWNTVVNNVFSISDISHVTLRFNFDKKNIDSLLQAAEFFIHDHRWNNNISIYYYPLEPISCINDNVFYKEDEYKSIYRVLYNNLYELGYYSGRESYLDFRSVSMPCYCASLSLNAVDYKGDLFQCQHLLCRDDFKIGNIWDGIIVNNNYTSWFDGSTPAQCKGCEVLPLCQCGCITKRNLGQDKYLCHIMKYRIASQEEIKVKELLKTL